MKNMKKHFQFKLKSASRLNLFSDDNLMDVCQKQFFKQQAQLIAMHGHLRAFIKDIMRITKTIDNMYTCFEGIYEPNWIGNLEFNNICQESVTSWRRFISDFNCNILKIVEDYDQEFPDMKRSIERRNKKLTELNRQKESYESYRNAKKIDEAKLNKAEIEWKTTEHDYFNLDASLQDSLTKFCDKRISVYVNLWTKLNAAKATLFEFLHEGCKNQMKVLSDLALMANTDKYSITFQVSTKNNGSKQLTTKAFAQSSVSLNIPPPSYSLSEPLEYDSYDNQNSPYTNILSTTAPIVTENPVYNRRKKNEANVKVPVTTDNSHTNVFLSPSKNQISSIQSSDIPKIHKANSNLSNNNNTTLRTLPVISTSDVSDSDNDTSESCAYSVIKKDKVKKVTKTENSDEIRTTNDNRISDVYATVYDTEFYYQIQATYHYRSSDVDELNLKKGDIIMVLPWIHDSQREEGWLYGENVLTKEKGLFPENHTETMD